MNPTVLTFGLLCIRMFTVLEMLCKKIWNIINTNTDIFRYLHSLFVHVVFRIQRSVFTYVESPYPYWSLCQVNESYKEIVLPLPSTDVICEFTNLLHVLHKNTFLADTEYLMYMANDTTILSRRFDVHRTDYALSTDKLRNPFLSVEYSNPDSKNRIVLEIDPRLLVVGNEILSETFVRRYFAYHSMRDFDERYTLHIMDRNIRMITLNAGDYICLGGTGEYRKMT